jgi:hypothetical protein
VRETLNWSKFRALKIGNWFEPGRNAYCQITAHEVAGCEAPRSRAVDGFISGAKDAPANAVVAARR